MSDERFDELLRSAAQDYNAPPPPPREEMWASIQAARREGEFQRRLAEREGRGSGRIWWAIGIAAVLLLGVGLGRFSTRLQPVAPVVVAPAAPAGGEVAYRVAAAQHLGEAEVLLTSFRTEVRAAGGSEEVTRWAKDLLSTTRLLLDSPAAGDAKVQLLLEDLELVLAQIAQLPTGAGAGAGEEVDLVNQAIEQGGVLPRLRTAIPAGNPALTEFEEE